jgi:hypothetical protein
VWLQNTQEEEKGTEESQKEKKEIKIPDFQTIS